MRTYLLLLLSLVSKQVSQAQPKPNLADKANQQPDYFQKVTYHGDHHQYYTTMIFLKDSTVYRLDNYQLMDQVSVYGYQFDNKKVAVRQGPTKIMYPGGQTYLSCEYIQGALNGPLMLFYRDGSIKRREFYKEGRLQESHCYTQQGEEQVCQALYQLPQFTGNAKELKRYLEKSLQTIAQTQQIQDIRIILTINEIGQVSNTRILSKSNPDDQTLNAGVKAVIEALPQWSSDRLNWKPATMDGVAVVEDVAIYVIRKKGFLTVYVP